VVKVGWNAAKQSSGALRNCLGLFPGPNITNLARTLLCQLNISVVLCAFESL